MMTKPFRTAMILAAGRGQRMRPLTDAQPKPLLSVGGKALIEWQIERLVAGGFTRIVINHAWLGSQLPAALGQGERYGAQLLYSQDSPDGRALETLGGIVQALPLLFPTQTDAATPLVVVSGDIYTEYDYAQLQAVCADIAQHPTQRAAHLVLTSNPDFHPHGDMPLLNGLVQTPSANDAQRLTFGNISVFHPSVFSQCPRGQSLKLFPWAYQLSDHGRMTGEHFTGVWHNVGTAAQLTQLDQQLNAQSHAMTATGT